MLRRQCEFMLLSIKGRYSASKVTLKTTSFSQRSLPFIHSRQRRFLSSRQTCTSESRAHRLYGHLIAYAYLGAELILMHQHVSSMIRHGLNDTLL